MSYRIWDADTAERWIVRWDAVMAGYLPRREELFTLVLDLLHELDADRRVLDLGCGAASFTHRLLAHNPASDVVALDWDPLMLSLAESGLSGRAVVHDADFTAPGWAAGVGERVDAVVACAALHMVDAAWYRDVVVEVAAALRPGGVFVDIDEMPLHPSSPALAGLSARLLRSLVESRFAGDSEDFGAWLADLSSQPEVAPLLGLRRRRFDRPADGREVRVARADERAAALLDAGFVEAAVIDRQYDTAVLVALRR